MNRLLLRCRWLRQCRILSSAKALAKPVAPERQGFTLLEIILALAILAGSLAALGEVMRLADQNAAMTRDETQAQMIATSIMDELVSGARALTATSPAQFDPDWDPQWLFSVALEEAGYVELVAVRVVVEQQLEARLKPARFELLRWLPNPDYVPPEMGAEQ
ncbi:MAG: prepilin-type N-terminal cleavage/methylation domain-containing protein [Pirellulales bacterium]